MFCPKCGNEIKENQKFCAKCGYEVKDSQNTTIKDVSSTDEIISSNDSSEKKPASSIFKNKKLMIILSGIVAVLIIGVIIALIITSGKDNSEDYSSVGEYVTFEDENDDTTVNKNNDSKETTAFISYVDDISGGVAKATLETQDGKSYQAIIDIKGNVRYVCDESESFFYAPTSEDDIGCIVSKNNANYKFINAKGETIKVSEEGEFDQLVACGGGNALVYKHEATIDSEAHLYGIINNKGEWSVPLKNYGQAPFIFQISNYKIPGKYIGEGIFDMTLDDKGNEHMLLNGNTGKAFWVYVGWSGHKDYDGNISFEDGEHYFICNMSGSYYHAFVSDIPLRTNGEIYGDSLEDKKELYRTTHDFVLYPDGTWKNIMKYPENGYEGITSDYPAMNGYEKAGDKWTKVEGEYITIYDYDTKKSAQFTAYKNSMISGIEFEGNYSVVRIKGVDQKSYFSIIDSSGTMQFDPISIYSDSYPEYSSEKVIYKNDADKYVIADKSGKILSENLEYDHIYKFNDDIAEASIDGKTCFINSKGEILLDEIKLPKNIK